MRRAIYPGSFDPVTNGHLDVIERAVKLFDEVIVAVAVNSQKQALFTLRRTPRHAAADHARPTPTRLRIVRLDGLLVDYARREGATAIVRGLRAVSDFEFEFQMALMNRKLESSVETIFLMPKEDYTYLSSRIIKEIARLGGEVGSFVPQCVSAALRGKYPPRREPADAMKIHQRQIPDDGLHIEGEESAEVLDLPNSDGLRALGPMRYSLDVGMNADGIWATGELAIDLELTCVRCLEAFAYPLEVTEVAVEMERPTTETVDLTPVLRDDILLALPAYPHCDWSGERVCPAEIASAEGVGPLGDNAGHGDSKPPSAWSTLDQLKTPSDPS